MKVNIYRVTWHTIFEKAGKEVRRTSPTTTLAAARDQQAAFSLIPVPPGADGEIARNVNIATQQVHSNVLAEVFKTGNGIEAT